MPMGRSGGILEPWELERLPGWARGTEDNVVEGTAASKSHSEMLRLAGPEHGKCRAWCGRGGPR